MLLALFVIVLAQVQTVETPWEYKTWTNPPMPAWQREDLRMAQNQTIETWRCPQRIAGHLLDETFREETRRLPTSPSPSPDNIIQDNIRLALSHVDKQVSNNASSIRQAYTTDTPLSKLYGIFTNISSTTQDQESASKSTAY